MTNNGIPLGTKPHRRIRGPDYTAVLNLVLNLVLDSIVLKFSTIALYIKPSQQF